MIGQFNARRKIAKHYACLSCLLLLLATSVAASEWQLKLRSGSVGEVRVERLQAQLTLADDGSVQLDDGRSRLWVGDRELPAQNWQLGLTEQSVDGHGGKLAVRLAGGPRMRGSWQLSNAGQVRVDLLKGALAMQFDDAQHWSLRLKSLPLAPWRDLLGEQLGWTPTTLAGSLRANFNQRPGKPVQIEGELSEVAFDSADGLHAGAGLAASFVVVTDPQVSADMQLSSGEILVNPAYVAIPEDGLRLRVDRVAAAWQLRADQTGAFSSTLQWPDQATQGWQIEATVHDLAEFYQRYLQSVWESQALPALSVAGELEFSARGHEATLQQLDYRISASRLHLATLGAEVLTSNASWQRDADGALELSWNSLGNGDFALGPATLSAVAQGGVWTATQAVEASLLEGRLELAKLRLDQRTQPWQAEASLLLQGIDLAALCRAFGWVEMPGVLSATFPSVSFSADHLSLSGGALVEAFQGQIELGALEVERPLSASPALTASASFSGLDLGEVTSAFDFGEITGLLDGEIKDLRVVNSKPVAFDAHMRTDSSYRGKRQISQRAVNNLSSVGGAGGGGLQRSVLRVFDRFRYDAIGLGCRLQNGVCAMTGLEAAQDGGFIIIRGSGLPRITVKGHAQRVDWDTLLARLMAATAGAMPTVE